MAASTPDDEILMLKSIVGPQAVAKSPTYQKAVTFLALARLLSWEVI